MVFEIQANLISILMEDNEDLHEHVDDLIGQLRDNNKIVKQAAESDQFELKPEDLEQFILNRTGKLINDSMDMVHTVKQYVECAPDAEGVGSLAELLKATTASIDTLSKILVQDKRGDTSTKLKQLDIAAKQHLMNSEHENKITLTRQEVLKQLVQSAEVIDITEEDSTSHLSTD